MYVKEVFSIWRLLKGIWVGVVAVTVYATLVFYLFSYQNWHFLSFPISITTILGTALSLLLGFRTNSAYDRWWEARKNWGEIVNDSRTLVRQAKAFIEAPDPEKNELVSNIAHLQIAWCYALANSLRRTTVLVYADLHLTSETVRLASRRAINAMLNLKEKFRYRKALYLLTGYPKKNLLYRSASRGRSGRPWFEDLALALDIVIGYSNIGIKLIHFLSAALFLFSLAIGGWAIYGYFFENVVEGWTAIMVFLSCVFSGLFFILGMLGEYILRILNEVKGRPYYTVSSVKVYSETANAAKAGRVGRLERDSPAAEPSR